MQRVWLGKWLSPQNPTLSVSVAAPLDNASIDVLCEGSDSSCPWTLFQVTFGRMVTAQEAMAWVHDPRPTPDAPRERSRDELGTTGLRLSKGVLQTCVTRNEG